MKTDLVIIRHLKYALLWQSKRYTTIDYLDTSEVWKWLYSNGPGQSEISKKSRANNLDSENLHADQTTVYFLSVAWPTGVQLLVFFCSSVPVVLFDTPGISRCRLQHVSVESSSLFHHSIYLWFIYFTWWSIDELENLHADRTTECFEPW